MTRYKHMITDVYIFQNGMVAVTDQNGEQMPKFQGKREFPLMLKIKNRIYRQKTPVTWHGSFSDGITKYIEHNNFDEEIPVKRGVSSIKEYLPPTLLVQKVLEVKDLSWRKEINLRNRALLSMLTISGLRVSEVLSLKKEQFNFNEEPDFIIIKNVRILKKRKSVVLNEVPIKKNGVYEPLVKIIVEYIESRKPGFIFNISRARAWQIVTGLTGMWCHYFRSQKMSHLVNTMGADAAGKIMKVVPQTVSHYYVSDWRDHKDEFE